MMRQVASALLQKYVLQARQIKSQKQSSSVLIVWGDCIPDVMR
jgi:hypothetical protein